MEEFINLYKDERKEEVFHYSILETTIPFGNDP